MLSDRNTFTSNCGTRSFARCAQRERKKESASAMAEIRIHPRYTEEAEKDALSPGAWFPDGRAYGRPRALTGDSSGTLDSLPWRPATGSLRSEPDINTILPLPGSGARAAHAQMVNVVSPRSSEEGEGEVVEEEEAEDGRKGVPHSLQRLSSEFMRVEVSVRGEGVCVWVSGCGCRCGWEVCMCVCVCVCVCTCACTCACMSM